jgi:7-cyano-7-deazaguanine reductase
MNRIDLLQTFRNPAHGRQDYEIKHIVHEFTSVCPKTGQPDFATMVIRYVPGEHCLELKSLKFYLQSFRTLGIFYEDVTNVIVGDLVTACVPRGLVVTSVWGRRGGIHSEITVEYGTLVGKSGGGGVVETVSCGQA